MLKKISIGVALILGVSSAFACTDFATLNGTNQSVLIAKNRDMYPGLQSIVAFHPKAVFSKIWFNGLQSWGLHQGAQMGRLDFGNLCALFNNIF
jgi:hypothetical protein